jgi:regulation of enolase protein 1 (concanavalin A-like superfamily)
VMSGLEFFNKRVNHSSCITRGISDWSLAPLPDEAAKDGIWIAIKRNSNKVECFYSFDLKEWVQTRQGLFPTEDTLKVGIVAACPMGEPFKVVFERFRIQMVG